MEEEEQYFYEEDIPDNKDSVEVPSDWSEHTWFQEWLRQHYADAKSRIPS